jgi:type II secretory pathway pseudopilin PulG
MWRRGLKSQITNYKSQIRHQRGYMLITLMLAVTLAAMVLLGILPEIGQQIRRDREEELCHRGTQYMRAIQHFYKKVNRYPTRIEELENTNNIRYLRKRYKDPLNRDPQTGKERDFKFLHMQDVSLNNGPMMGQVPGLGGQQLPNGMPGGALGQMQQLAGQMQQAGGLQPSGPSAAAQNNADEDQSGSGNAANPQGNSGSSPSSSSPFSSSSSSNTGTGSAAGAGFGGQVFGGGPILGVASTNKKDKTIREFNKKNHYNDWLFIYDPTSDRGGLLVGPWQTPPTSTIPGANPIGQPIQGPQSGQGFGQGNSGFGQGNSPFGGGQFGGSPSQGSQPPQTQGQNPPQQ